MSTHPKQRVCSPVNGLTVCASSVFFCTPACPVQMALSYLSLRCPRIFWLKDSSVLSWWVMGVQFVSSWSKKTPPKKQKREHKTKTQCYSGHHSWQVFGFIPFMQTQAHLCYDSPRLFIMVPIMLLLTWWHHHRVTGSKAGAPPANMNANMTVSAADFWLLRLN